MPANRFLFFGTLLTASTALVWIGAELTRRVEWLLPYTGAAGVALIAIGVVQEGMRRARR